MNCKGLTEVIYGEPFGRAGMIYSMGVGKKIKRLREDRDLRPGELARMAGVKLSTLSDLEHERSKRPRSDTLIKIAAALGVDPELIMSREGQSPIARAGTAEADLLRLYQELSDPNRAALLATARALVDSQPEIRPPQASQVRKGTRGPNGH